MYKDPKGKVSYTNYQNILNPDEKSGTITTSNSKMCSSASGSKDGEADVFVNVCVTEMYPRSGINLLVFGVSGVKGQAVDYEAGASHISRLEIFRANSEGLDSILVYQELRQPTKLFFAYISLELKF